METKSEQLRQGSKSTHIAWHPAFVQALEVELDEYKEALEFHAEYQLTSEPRKSIFKHSNENLSCMTKNETPKQSFCQNFAVLELLCTIKMTISSKKRHKTRSNGYFKLKLVVGKYETGEN